MYFSVVLVLVLSLYKGGVAGCEVGWLKDPHSNNCYRLYPAALTWQDALNSCIGQKALLAVISNNDTNSYITKNITRGLRSWIGLHDRKTPNQWEWSVTGNVAHYLNWAIGEPNNHLGLLNPEECAEIEDVSGQWNDETCDSLRPYVCQRSLGCDPADLRGLQNNTAYNGTLLSVDSIITLNETCLTGYRAGITTADTICQADGTWSRADFDCTEIYCNFPSTSLTNGGYIIDGNDPYGVGTKITYSCKPGYVLWGNEACTCRDVSLRLQYGIWDQPPICIVAPECDPGWTNLNYFCYKYIEELLTWEDAGKRCAQIGSSDESRLVSVSSHFENEVVKELSEGGTSVWIGLQEKTMVWEWTDYSSLKYKNFAAGEPNNGQFFWEVEDCVELYVTSGEWNDEQCGSLREFVCEKPLS